MNEKSLGQVAQEAFSKGLLALPWQHVVVKEEWQAAAVAVRDAVLAEREDEVERLRAEVASLSQRLAEVLVDLPRETGPEWVEWKGGFRLIAHRPVEVASLAHDPGGSIAWTAGQHFGRVIGSSPETLDLAKRLAEVAAGVER